MTGWRLALLLFLPIGFLTFPLDAWAAKLRTDVGARRVGVGQGFEVKLTATHEDGEPEPGSPQLPVRGQAEVRGPSVGTQRRVMMRNFSFDSESSVVATWVVTPTKKGKLVIGPGTFQVGGKTLRGETIVVEVVDQPQDVPRRDPFGRRGSIFGPDPSDIFGDDPFDLLSRRMGRGRPEAPPEYQVESAPHPIAFLRIVLDKKRIVLGEPVRLTVLSYGSRGSFQEVSPNEPSLPDFLSYSVLESSHDEPSYRTSIQGQEFIVQKLREYVLVPLKTGHLTIGGMTAVLQGPGHNYPLQGSPLGIKVTSPDAAIEVVDTPEEGKPPGYFPGDVGTYRLKAEVSPKTLKAGEYVQVLVQIQGRGQIPTKVLLPESKSLVWEPPTMTGGPEIRDGELQGSRVLEYALQVKETGHLDLGEVRLPYFDHSKNKYKIARAQLGTITVDPSSASPPKDPSSQDDAKIPEVTAPDEGVPLAPRTKVRSVSSSRWPAPPPWFWWVVLLLPAAAATITGLIHSLRRLKISSGAKQKSQASDHLRQARIAWGEGKHADTTKALERALYESLDRATGQKNRGHLREHLARELQQVGLDATLARGCQDFLMTLEQVRYDSTVHLEEAHLARATELVRTLSKLEKKRGHKRATERGEA